MDELLHDSILEGAAVAAESTSLRHKGVGMTYGELSAAMSSCATALLELGIERSQRVAIYLPKCFEAVIAMFGASAAGACFVPINPVLKSRQVRHILRDCEATILITSSDRLSILSKDLALCEALRAVIVVDERVPGESEGIAVEGWGELMRAAVTDRRPHRCIGTDMAAIMYTSGSTGNPKGVVLTHQNMRLGAKSAATYLRSQPSDRILAVLSLGFDAGLVQVTQGFASRACVVLLEYLLPRDVIKALVSEQITGLAGVPALWIALAKASWPESAVESLRYLTNSGGSMPLSILESLRRKLPRTEIYLQYGLTEAFRSTYLPPEELDRRPGSIGKAMPSVEVMVVRDDGSTCAPHEPGELVHRGPLVALGYWNKSEETAARFKPVPGTEPGIPGVEIAVWSGDTVKMDEEGFLYFISRKDDMIKTSAYRVSPTEVEEVIYASNLVGEAVVIGVPHWELGQAIVAVVTTEDENFDPKTLTNFCRKELPNFMTPAKIIVRETIPRSANGKFDRKLLISELQGLFAAEDPSVRATAIVPETNAGET